MLAERSTPVRLAFLIVLVLCVYANALGGVFQLDDGAILADSRLDSFANYVAHLVGMIRPAVRLTFLIDRAVWRSQPAGYHLFNLLFHLGSGALVFAIVRHLARAETNSIRATTIAFWTALLFLIHPLGTETVTYVSGRPSGMMAFFYLAALHAYQRAKTATAITCLAMALLSKEIALTFPLALLLVEWTAHQQSGAELWSAAKRRHLPFWGVTAGFLIVALLTPRYVHLFTVSRSIRPLLANIAAQIQVVAYAIGLFVQPGRISIDHDVGSGVVSTWPLLGATVLLGAMLSAALALKRTHPMAAFGMLWFFLQLLPTNSVLPRYDLLSERNLYLAMPGLLLAIVVLWIAVLDALRGGSRFAARAGVIGLRWAAVAIAAALALSTINRNAVYSTSIGLWTDAAIKAPAKARPHINLGYAYYADGHFDRAIVEFRRALILDRGNPRAQMDLLAAWRAREGEP